MDFVSNFHYKACIKPHIVPSVSIKKMKLAKINTNNLIFYLVINFY